MRRSDFIAGLGAAAWPLTARAAVATAGDRLAVGYSAGEGERPEVELASLSTAKPPHGLPQRHSKQGGFGAYLPGGRHGGRDDGSIRLASNSARAGTDVLFV